MHNSIVSASLNAIICAVNGSMHAAASGGTATIDGMRGEVAGDNCPIGPGCDG